MIHPTHIVEPKRIPELDGVRGLAILSVILWHCIVSQMDPTPGTALSYAQLLLSYSWTGVDLFFVLSGFLIGGILLDNKAAVNYFQAFYTRRIFRIFPLYYLFLILTAIAYQSALRDIPKIQSLFEPALAVWTFPFHLQNFAMAAAGTLGGYWLAPTWSLAIEEHFYLGIPFLIRFLKSPVKWLLAVVATAMIFRLILILFSRNWVAAYVLTFARVDSLAIGVLIAIVFRNKSLWSWMERHRNIFLWSFGVGCLALIEMLLSRMQPGHPMMILFGYTFLALFYACLLILVLIHPKAGIVFRQAWLRRLGGLAYCLYLIHLPINGLTHALLTHRSTSIDSPTNALVTVLAIAVMIVVASASWKYFERPILGRGHRFVYQHRPPPTA